MKRRLLPIIEIDAHPSTCGECDYLEPGPRCGLFTGSLEEGSKGPMRADECRAAERRHDERAV